MTGWLGNPAPWHLLCGDNTPASPPSPAVPLPHPSPCPSEPSPSKAVAVPPTSARALGGSLFRGHKAPLILCSAPSHVTGGRAALAGSSRRSPTRRWVSPPLPLFPQPRTGRRALRCPGRPAAPVAGGGAGSRICLPPSHPGPARWDSSHPERVAAGAQPPCGAQIFGLGEKKKALCAQLSLCKCLASRAEGPGPPQRDFLGGAHFPSARGFPGL